MKEEWAIPGLDLHLDLPASGRRKGLVRKGLEESLREAIRSGRLTAGTRLPSSRALATDLRLARNTVADAYNQLVAEGWLTARVGAGTHVAARPLAGAEPGADEAPAREAPVTSPAPAAPAPCYDLRAGFPTLTAFPRSAWLAATRRGLNSAPADVFGYGDPRGLPVLRQALAEYLARARGVHASPDRVVVCSGFVQGLSLLTAVLRDRGAHRVGMEAYGHQRHRDVVTAAGLHVTPVPVDEAGAVAEALDGSAAAVLTPAHQFPLGMALAPHRRTEVVEWAKRTGGLVIEDDYDGEFRYDRHPVGALQALAPDQVAYAGTASKTLAPGLRLGWLVLPPALVSPVTDAKRLADTHTSVIDQLTLAELLTGGDYDRHVRRCRLAYRRRRDRLLDVLHQQAPDLPVGGIAAGLHALVRLPAHADEQAVVEQAVVEQAVVERGRRHGVTLEGLAAYRFPGAADHGPALVVGYTTPPDHAYTAALACLAATLRDSSDWAEGGSADSGRTNHQAGR